MIRSIVLVLLLLQIGCNINPISKDIDYWRQQGFVVVPLLSEQLKEGDIIFRLGTTKVASGLINFSEEVAKATNSDFSHAVLVYKKIENDFVLVDITETGITRRYLIDWFIEGSKNIVVKRLTKDYEYIIPQVLSIARKTIEKDVLYDPKFDYKNDKFYCTELVDYFFRETGYPLASRIRIKDWPNYNLFIESCCMIGGINVNYEVVIAGNDDIGLFSSKMLETIVDLRK